MRSVQHFFGVSAPRALREHWTGEEYWEGDGAVNTGWEQQNAIQYRTIQESLYCRYNSWREAYEQYDRRVKKFFDDKPDDALLTMNIPEGDGWNPLCSFLEVERPASDFPHANAKGSVDHPILDPHEAQRTRAYRIGPHSGS